MDWRDLKSINRLSVTALVRLSSFFRGFWYQMSILVGTNNKVKEQKRLLMSDPLVAGSMLHWSQGEIHQWLLNVGTFCHLDCLVNVTFFFFFFNWWSCIVVFFLVFLQGPKGYQGPAGLPGEQVSAAARRAVCVFMFTQTAGVFSGEFSVVTVVLHQQCCWLECLMPLWASSRVFACNQTWI